VVLFSVQPVQELGYTESEYRWEVDDVAKLEVGQVAPDFALPAQTGETVSLSGCRGKIVVLFFYPKDSTPG
jgi:cytochrome oxidase Cu insertion factor (SCO1/SenC/PrrC family)